MAGRSDIRVADAITNITFTLSPFTSSSSPFLAIFVFCYLNETVLFKEPCSFVYIFLHFKLTGTTFFLLSELILEAVFMHACMYFDKSTWI